MNIYRKLFDMKLHRAAFACVQFRTIQMSWNLVQWQKYIDSAKDDYSWRERSEEFIRFNTIINEPPSLAAMEAIERQAEFEQYMDTDKRDTYMNVLASQHHI